MRNKLTLKIPEEPIEDLREGRLLMDPMSESVYVLGLVPNRDPWGPSFRWSTVNICSGNRWTSDGSLEDVTRGLKLLPVGTRIVLEVVE